MYELVHTSGFCPRELMMAGCNQYSVLTGHNLHHHYLITSHFVPKPHSSIQSENKHWQPHGEIVASAVTMCYRVNGPEHRWVRTAVHTDCESVVVYRQRVKYNYEWEQAKYACDNYECESRWSMTLSKTHGGQSVTTSKTHGGQSVTTSKTRSGWSTAAGETHGGWSTNMSESGPGAATREGKWSSFFHRNSRHPWMLHDLNSVNHHLTFSAQKILSGGKHILWIQSYI